MCPRSGRGGYLRADIHHGWWRVSAVEAPHYLEFIDGFAPTRTVIPIRRCLTNTRVSLHEESAGTRMRVTTVFPTAQAMEQLITMGMEEGMAAAMGQIDDLLTTESV